MNLHANTFQMFSKIGLFAVSCIKSASIRFTARELTALPHHTVLYVFRVGYGKEGEDKRDRVNGLG